MNRKTLWGLATLALGLTLVSCSDTDLDNNNTHPNGDDSGVVDNTIDTHEALSRLLGALADVDSLPDNWNSEDYVVSPTLGVEKDASNPHVRYVAVNDAAEADRLYCSYTATPNDGEAHNHEWKVDGIGTLKFEVKNQADLYATLKVSVQQLPSLEEVQFVPASALGENGLIEPKGTYYTFGDVVRIKLDDNIMDDDDEEEREPQYQYWVCVRPCSKTHCLRKSYWASLQPQAENFKDIDKNNTLPTKLCTEKSEGERMVQNFFNVLRLAANPATFTQGTTIDKITDEFSPTLATKVSDIWEMDDTWSKIVADDYKCQLLDYMKKTTQLNAFYYGYSKVLVGSGNYRFYNLNLSVDGTKTNNNTLFNVTKPTTPYIYTNEYERDFKKFAHTNHSNEVYIDSYKTNDIDNQFLVCVKSGAELEGKTGIDVTPQYNFSYRRGVRIYDVVRAHTSDLQLDNTPFYCVGDEVQESKMFKGNQLCFVWRKGLSSLTEFPPYVSYFVCSSDGQLAKGVTPPQLSDKELRCILYMFYRAAYDWNHSEKEKYVLKDFKEEETTPKEQIAYSEMLSKLYKNYLNGRNYNNGHSTITVKVNGQTYRWDNNEDTFERLNNDPDLENIIVVSNSESCKSHFEDNFSINRQRTFGLKGLNLRENLRDAIYDDLNKYL